MSNGAQKSDLLFADLEKAVDFLARTLDKPKDDYMRAATIQAFEMCFELSWKYLQARLEEAGLSASSPRAAFRESGKAGLLNEVEAWMDFTDQRNLTVHTYQPRLADEVYTMAEQKFLPAAQDLLRDASPDRDI